MLTCVMTRVMRSHYTLARLYVPQSLSLDAEIELPKAQSHYLATVLRKSVGDSARIFNGEDGEWRAEITSVTKSAVALTIAESLRVPSVMPDVRLYFAPIKRARTEFILEKATELGTASLHPVITQRTQFPKLRMDRAEAQIIEAAEQTERLDIPKIYAPQKLMTAIDALNGSIPIYFADEGGDCVMAQSAFDDAKGPAALLIGPEGGFTDQERSQLRAMDAVTPVSLGPRILRADTAAVSMLTLWQAAQGDWT